jgi:sugar phosphate isomerase/epimerase
MRRATLVFQLAALVPLLGVSACVRDGPRPQARMEWVRVAADARGFSLASSGRPFTPWGFNYDHDEHLRLLEDYWDAEWSKVEEDFEEMQALGANVVRIHLQLGRFMETPTAPRVEALERLARVVALAERLQLYLDVTGLGCYRKTDVPPWYDRLSEPQRWDVQARFWDAVAARCAASPAVFCYDLMNEPVVPGAPREDGDWLGPPFAGTYCYVQFITLDPAGRPRGEIARQWLRRLTRAIRARDARHLITVGLVPWSLDRPGLTSGFVPRETASELDFLCAHVYPDDAQPAEAMEVLAGFSVGRPVVIEETFPLNCSPESFERFLDGSSRYASGWIGFYWGRMPDECRRSSELSDQLLLGWLERFRRGAPRPHD